MAVMDVMSLVEESREEMIATRRRLHREPELSLQEVETAKMVAGRVREIEGVEDVREGVGGHGVTALIRGAQPGRVLLLRADIDALPIHEATGAEYASLRDGVMHACGHDGHTAIMLTVARVLAAQRERLSGTVLLVFQPAEEVGLGARAMIDDGVMEFAGAPVDAALGLHLISALQVGKVAVCPGPSMASSDTFEIVLTGRGGHGAMPQQCIDPISTGAELVLALQRIVSRELSALTPAVLSTCVFQSGSASNIVPQEARLAGTIRAYAPEVRAAIHQKVERITAGVAAAGGTTYELRISEGTPPVVNDLAMCELVREAAGAVVGAGNVVQPEPMLPSDDVALFLDRVPGCYFNVGSGDPTQGTDFPHHHPCFDLTEESLVIAASVLSEAAMRYLG